MSDKKQKNPGSRVAVRGALVAGAALAFVGAGATAAAAAGPDETSPNDGPVDQQPAAVGSEAAPSDAAATGEVGAGAVAKDAGPAPVEVADTTAPVAEEGTLARWYQDGMSPEPAQGQELTSIPVTDPVEAPPPVAEPAETPVVDPASGTPVMADYPLVGRWDYTFRQGVEALLVVRPDGTFANSRDGVRDEGTWEVVPLPTGRLGVGQTLVQLYVDGHRYATLSGNDGEVSLGMDCNDVIRPDGVRTAAACAGYQLVRSGLAPVEGQAETQPGDEQTPAAAALDVLAPATEVSEADATQTGELAAAPTGLPTVDAALVLTDGAGMIPVGSVDAADGTPSILVLYAGADGTLQVGAISQAAATGDVVPTPQPVTSGTDDSPVPLGVVKAEDGSQAVVVLYVGADGIVRVGQIPMAPVQDDPAPYVQPAPGPTATPQTQPTDNLVPPTQVDQFLGEWLPEGGVRTVFATTSLVLRGDGTITQNTGRGSSDSVWTRVTPDSTSATWGTASTVTEPAVEGRLRTTTIPAPTLVLMPDGRMQVTTYTARPGVTEVTYYTKVVVPTPEAPVAAPPGDDRPLTRPASSFVGQYQTDTATRLDTFGSSSSGVLPVVVRDDGTITVGDGTFHWVQTGADTLTVTIAAGGTYTEPAAEGPARTVTIPAKRFTVTMLDDGRLVLDLPGGQVTASPSTTPVVNGGPIRQADNPLVGYWYTEVRENTNNLITDSSQGMGLHPGTSLDYMGLPVVIRPDGTLSIIGHRLDGGWYDIGVVKGTGEESTFDELRDSLKDAQHIVDSDLTWVEDLLGNGFGTTNQKVGSAGYGSVLALEGQWESVDESTIQATFPDVLVNFRTGEVIALFPDNVYRSLVAGLDSPHQMTADQTRDYVPLTITFTLLPDGRLSVSNALTNRTVQGSFTVGVGLNDGAEDTVTAVRTVAPWFAGSWETQVTSSPFMTSQAHLSLGADGTFTADMGQLGLGSSSTVWIGTWEQTSQTTATLSYTAWDITNGYGRVLEQGTSELQIVGNGGLRLSTAGYSQEGISEFYRSYGTIQKAGESPLATAAIPDVLASATPTPISSMVGLWWSQYPTSLEGAVAGGALFPILVLNPDGTAGFYEGPAWVKDKGYGEDQRMHTGTWEHVDATTALLTLDDEAGTQITVTIARDGVLRMWFEDPKTWDHDVFAEISGGGWAFDRVDNDAQIGLYDETRARNYRDERHFGDVWGEVLGYINMVKSGYGIFTQGYKLFT